MTAPRRIMALFRTYHTYMQKHWVQMEKWEKHIYFIKSIQLIPVESKQFLPGLV